MSLRRVANNPPHVSVRPDGKLLWLHATSTQRLIALRDVATRLCGLYPDLSVISTWEPGVGALKSPNPREILIGVLAEDLPSEMRLFLDTWAPDLCIWAGGNLRRTLTRYLAEADVPTLLTDIEVDELPSRASRWWPDHRTRLLNSFSAILSPSKQVSETLQRTGIPAHRITVTGPLSQSPLPPTCSHENLNEMQAVLSGRPVWLASHVKLEELTTILNAHRKALKLLHRLLLIVSLENWADLEAARAIIRGTGLNFADWDTGEEPVETQQVLLSDRDDIGLWYRVSPVTLIGGSLERKFTGNTPLDAAALGSAVLYGKGISDHVGVYRALRESGAAAQVRSMGELADEVIRLSSPDAAAEMALAGWNYVTQGSRTTDRLLEIAQDLLDMPDIGDETT
ncbi:3-deoxy-D-manno-octulosonic acid transferase [Epibacterium ulvae]|uniref:3-deoxy-D-manno-octulosonic acid transferase n=1 Tax=Epibacterium ulvae TaxID=1156985 RepID=UPI001BFC1410|nr:glycosyltransferase N-terminal domain-containing protein [Epibacterium ulvae]MBT8153507.1 3-deoxy-D-manno-octulosonic acid transferase [Epibacterium ulvae]